jgi:hypothetical protein
MSSPSSSISIPKVSTHVRTPVLFHIYIILVAYKPPHNMCHQVCVCVCVCVNFRPIFVQNRTWTLDLGPTSVSYSYHIPQPHIFLRLATNVIHVPQNLKITMMLTADVIFHLPITYAVHTSFCVVVVEIFK